MRTRQITIRAGLATTVTLLALAAPANADSVQDLRLSDWRNPLATPSLAATTAAANPGDTTAAEASVALSQERYYSSYGTPHRSPPAPTRAPAPSRPTASTGTTLPSGQAVSSRSCSWPGPE